MVGASKILTVSYGTFSCTLEGFNDPFNTMKAIAEYFRDLAADDRYFGAEPPTPDAAMLHKIAEREVQRRVEAKIQDNGVILRTGDSLRPKAEPAPPAPAPVAPALAEPLDAEPLYEDLPASAPHAVSESVAAKLLRIRSAVASARAVSDTAPVSDTASVSDTAAPQDTIADRFAPFMPQPDAIPAQAAPQSAPQSAPPPEPAVLAAPEPVAAARTEPEAVSEPETPEKIAPAVAGPTDLPQVDTGDETFADSADWIDGAIDTASFDTPLDRLAADAAPDAVVIAEDDVEISEYETEAPDNPEPNAEFDAAINDVADQDGADQDGAGQDDLMLASLAAALSGSSQSNADQINSGAAPSDAEPGVPVGAATALLDAAINDPLPEETEEATSPLPPQTEAVSAPFAAGTTAETATEIEIETAKSATLTDQTDTAQADPIDTAQADPIDIVQADQIDTQDADNDLRSLADAVAPEQPAPESHPIPIASEPASAEPAANTDTAESAVEPAATISVKPRRARVIKVRRADLTETQSDDAKPQTAAEGTGNSPDEDTLSPEAEAALLRELSADAPGTATPAPQSKAVVAYRQSLTGTDEDESVTRLIEHTNTKMEGPENRRRLSALAHLKAAVAATVADRLGRGPAVVADDTRADPYRNDLERVVRPRRPGQNAAGNAGREKLVAADRPAPLMLVSEQRIDKPRPPVPATQPRVAPVRPRRVSAGNLAVDDTLEDELDSDASGSTAVSTPRNIFGDSRGFAEFAEKLGADGLQDLLEAAAAYSVCIEGRPHISRPHLMRHVVKIRPEFEANRENMLRTFGALLRQGRLEKVRRGQFALNEGSVYLTEGRKMAKA
ncbi:MAG: hypothetical protein U1D35_06320 [Paracoccaceae bacterium]|nr:hypothetical protein [Paracoccaceae bacterium]